MAGYEGIIASIPLGMGGLLTDNPNSLVTASKLIRAQNATLFNKKLEKDFGSRRWNSSALSSGVIGFTDWWPDSVNQRIIAVDRSGNVIRFKYYYSSSTVTATTADTPTTLKSSPYCNFLTCGAEEAGNERKLFILTGKHHVQVITGDGTTRRNILNGAADWSGTNQPFFGFIHRSRPYLFGNENDPHRIYVGLATNNEDFTTSPLTFQVHPGKGERLIFGFVYKKKAFVLKYPSGLYILDDSDATITNWKWDLLNESFGGASSQCGIEVLDDFFIANNYGGVTSLTAAQTLGDIKSADVFYQLAIERTIREEMSQTGGRERNVMYYPAKKMAFITYRSAGGIQNDRMVQISVHQKGAEATIISKDQPNCLGLIKDNFGVERPYYGAEDGYIYQMDQVDRNVNNSAFRMEFVTPHMDFAEGDPQRAELMKSFDFVEFVYEPTGDWTLNFEVYIDGLRQKQGTFRLDGRSELDAFVLDTNQTDAEVAYSKRIQIGGQGRRVAVKAWNETTSQNVKLLRVNIYFKYTNHQQVVR